MYSMGTVYYSMYICTKPYENTILILAFRQHAICIIDRTPICKLLHYYQVKLFLFLKNVKWQFFKYDIRHCIKLHIFHVHSTLCYVKHSSVSTLWPITHMFWSRQGQHNQATNLHREVHRRLSTHIWKLDLPNKAIGLSVHQMGCSSGLVLLLEEGY